MNVMKRMVISCLAILGLALTASSPEAGEKMATTGLACDTVQQVERFAELISSGKSEQEALMTVNDENDNPELDTVACIHASMMYERGEKKSEVKIEQGMVEIYEARIFGAVIDGEWRSVRSFIQYLPFFAAQRVGIDI